MRQEANIWASLCHKEKSWQDTVSFYGYDSPTGRWGRFRPSEARLKQGTWQSLSSVLVIKSGKKWQQWQKLILRLVLKQWLKSSLGSCKMSEMPVPRPFRPWSEFQKSGFSKFSRWFPWADRHGISEGSWLTDQRQAEERCPKVPCMFHSSQHSHQYLR